MDDEQLQQEQEKVIELLESLKDTDPGTDKWKDTVNAINVLQTKINESRRNLYDYDVKTIANEKEDARFKEEMKLKKEELAAKIEDEKCKRRNNLIVEGTKAGVSFLGIVIPLKFYAAFLEQGYKFETKNIVSSVTFKNFLRFIKPKS